MKERKKTVVMLFIQLMFYTFGGEVGYEEERERKLRGNGENALSNDFRGHSRKRKKVFIHHYCHGLWQMITICLHPYF